MKRRLRIILPLLLLFVLFFVMITALLRTIVVTKQSMDPTLTEDQALIIWQLPYMGPFSFLGGPARGEIVVFREPINQRLFIKRVIALPGETVEARDGLIYVNSQPVIELYLPGKYRTRDFPPHVVGAEQYFLVGDNRDTSLDSRNFGPVGRSNILGVAFFSFRPFDRFGTFDNPAK